MPGAIVVGIDASTPSRAALEWSVARAAEMGADLELVHVVEDSAERSDATAFVDAERAYAQSLEVRVSISASVAEGRPADMLATRSEGRSLLVVGTHKTGFIYGRTFGSSFLELASTSHCDVAFIPERIGRERRNVVVGVQEQSVPGDAALLFAAAEAARSSQTLVLVSSSEAVRPATRSTAAARRSAMLSRAVELAKNSQPRLRVRTRSTEFTTAEALVDASASATLLVIARGGATNHDVLLNMSSPVIVVLAP